MFGYAFCFLFAAMAFNGHNPIATAICALAFIAFLRAK